MTPRFRASAIVLTTVLLSASFREAFAQQVLGASTIGDESGATTPAPNGPGMPGQGQTPAILNSTLPLFRFGEVAVRPHAHYTHTHADGLRSATGQLTTTTVETYSLGTAFHMGENWDADYTHAWTRYTSPLLRRSEADHLSINGHISRPGWAGSFSERYSKTDTPLVETGRQTGKETSDTTVSVGWQPAPKWMATVSGDQRLTFIKTLPDYFQWAVTGAANRQITDTLSAGGSLSDGYVMMYKASDYTFLRPALQASWIPTRKVSVSANIGWDYWKSLGHNRTDMNQSSYGAGISYAPWETTLLTASAGRGVSPSPFHDLVSTSDQWSVRLQQRLFQHFTLQVGMTDQRARYLSSRQDFAAQRTDHRRSYESMISTRFFRRITASAFYSYSRNESGLTAFTFYSHQVGFQLGIRF